LTKKSNFQAPIKPQQALVKPFMSQNDV